MLFADVRGFSSLSEQLPPAEVAARLNYFYRLSAETIFELNGTLDKFIGDSVMAFFGAPFTREDHPQRAVEAARTILKGMAMVTGREHLHLGAGVATGEAFVGNVGEGEVTDFTAVGDVVNVAARLQGLAAEGEVLVTEGTYQAVALLFPDAPRRELELKGKSQPVPARVIQAW